MSNQIGARLTGDQVLAELMAGNKRYLNSTQRHPHQSISRRMELRSGQHPLAVILGCSDSRVPPEIVFDQGLGDLFVIRVAGHVVDDMVLGSIEYAVEHLHTPLIVVLGHSKCGAVAATVMGGELAGHLPHLTRVIQPAVDRVKGQAGELIENAVRSHASMVAAQLASAEPILAEWVTSDRLSVVAACYDLDSGKVAILS